MRDNKITKSGAALKSADARLVVTPEELALINEQSLKELTEEEVFAFRVVACDTLPDRDCDRFTKQALDDFAPKFVGRPMLSDHQWTSKEVTARIYAAEVEPIEDAEGEYRLVVRAYIPRSEHTAETIELIETGLLREVSVGVSVRSSTCSICGKDYLSPDCPHNAGRQYDGATCYRLLDGGRDVYELSFVAVPAQPAAGVTKSADPETDPEKKPETEQNDTAAAGAEAAKTLAEALEAMLGD